MKVTFREVTGFQVAGLTQPLTSDLDISGLWQKLNHLTKQEPVSQFGSGQYYGVCYGFGQGTPTYMAGFDWKRKENHLLEGCQVLDIPANTYAVVEIQGPIQPTIKQGFDWFMTQYLPGSDLVLTGDPSFEVYTEGDMDAPDYGMELWIPVKPKV